MSDAIGSINSSAPRPLPETPLQQLRSKQPSNKVGQHKTQNVDHSSTNKQKNRPVESQSSNKLPIHTTPESERNQANEPTQKPLTGRRQEITDKSISGRSIQLPQQQKHIAQELESKPSTNQQANTYDRQGREVQDRLTPPNERLFEALA